MAIVRVNAGEKSSLARPPFVVAVAAAADVTVIFEV
jgi:hypothetical protein